MPPPTPPTPPADTPDCDTSQEVSAGTANVGGTETHRKPGKYLLLSVPEFAADPLDAGNLMTSYLRLGASHATGHEAAHDKELFEKIPLSNPSGGHLTPAGTPVDGAAEDPKGVFVDDQRERGTMPGHNLTPDQRAEYSRWLHGRGGWRDHSDGNRISTTWGDKVEVVRGNYRMLVLGRQSDEAQASGWDASGNHVQDFAPGTMPGASVRVEYEQKFGGVWHLQNTTEGVIQSSNFAGDFYQYWWGDKHENTIGQEVTPDPAIVPGNPPVPRTNPNLRSKTWAESIDSQTGSALRPVPWMEERKWANSIKSYTGSSARRVSTMVTETYAKSIEEKTDCAGTIDTKTFAGATTEVIAAGAIASNTIAATIIEATEVGVKVDATVAHDLVELLLCGRHTNIEVSAVMLDVFCGLKFEFSFDQNYTTLKKKEIALKSEMVKLEEFAARLDTHWVSKKTLQLSLESSIKALKISLG